MRENDEMDRRHGNILREMMVPIIVSLIVGVGGSYMSNQLTVNTISTKVEAMKEDLQDLRTIASAVQQSQIQIATQNQWMRGIDDKIVVINNDLLFLRKQAIRDEVYREEESRKKTGVKR